MFHVDWMCMWKILFQNKRHKSQDHLGKDISEKKIIIRKTSESITLFISLTLFIKQNII